MGPPRAPTPETLPIGRVSQQVEAIIHRAKSRAGVAKLADATALGAVVPKGLVGSNPSARTSNYW